MEDYATSATSIDCTEYESKPKTKQNTKESDITKMQSGNGINLSISEKGLKATSLLPSIQKYLVQQRLPLLGGHNPHALN
jgi:hypothetical protein